jgi:hypothetical protein
MVDRRNGGRATRDCRFGLEPGARPGAVSRDYALAERPFSRIMPDWR